MSESVGPYSPILQSGEWCILSGQIGLRGGELVTGGLGPELSQAFMNLRSLLRSKDLTLDNIVKIFEN